MTASGFLASEFAFVGFVPARGQERQEKLRRMGRDLQSLTVVFFEAPHRIRGTLQSMVEDDDLQLRTRQCVLCREVTKRYEDFHRGTVEECLVSLVKKFDLDAVRKSKTQIMYESYNQPFFSTNVILFTFYNNRS